LGEREYTVTDTDWRIAAVFQDPRDAALFAQLSDLHERSQGAVPVWAFTQHGWRPGTVEAPWQDGDDVPVMFNRATEPVRIDARKVRLRG
jgi:hypothetical protein